MAEQTYFSNVGAGAPVYDFEFPRGLQGLFKAKIGEPLGRRKINKADLLAWAGHHVRAVPTNQHEAAFKAVIAGALGVEDEDLEGIASPYRLAAIAQEIWQVKPEAFKGEALRKGCWQDGDPVPLPADAQGPRDPPTPVSTLPSSTTSDDDLREQVKQLAAAVSMMAEKMGKWDEAPARQKLVAPVEPRASSTAPGVRSHYKAPEDQNDVRDWAEAMDADADRLVTKLQMRFVTGRGHLPGGEILETHFRMLKNWVLSSSQLEGWQECPEQVALGNDLLLQVKLQQKFVEEGMKRSSLLSRLAEKDDDPVEVAAAQERRDAKKRFQFKERKPWPKRGQGNARAGDAK
ncbi:hypothetical protein DIPPA_30283 [Diplonema papillatum]|nr:hypothetical protein DIPPA_13122 [Diplonema papillatum]KAJ9444703.1 hypothetical protein DIPPA_35284 [Diplonema papillatum]KAJ9455318.1 hypothetical protein DIPPA_22057 [Diplonema papillatum]KAJ9470060.1 hypothetical protein DIPPA_30283 [Diplonema papillatum]